MARVFTWTVVVYDTLSDFPATGDVDVIYIDASKNTAYRYDVDYYAISSAEVDIWGALGSVSKGGGGGGGASWGSITGTLSSQTDLQSALDAKQDDLVSGTNIKTVNSTSLLGSGDVAVQPTLVSGTNIKTINGSSILGSGDLVVSGGSGLQGAQIQFNNTQGQSLFGFNAALTAANGGTGTPTASRLDVYPVTPNKTLTNVSLTINVSTLGVGALARLVVYSNSNSFPTTKLYESTDIDCSTTGEKTVLTGLTFTAGTTYWLGFYSNGGATFRTIVASQMLPIFAPSLSTLTVAWSRINTTLGTAPSTFNYNTYSAANQVNIVIKQV